MRSFSLPGTKLGKSSLVSGSFSQLRPAAKDELVKRDLWTAAKEVTKSLMCMEQRTWADKFTQAQLFAVCLMDTTRRAILNPIGKDTCIFVKSDDAFTYGRPWVSKTVVLYPTSSPRTKVRSFVVTLAHQSDDEATPTPVLFFFCFRLRFFFTKCFSTAAPGVEHAHLGFRARITAQKKRKKDDPCRPFLFFLLFFSVAFDRSPTLRSMLLHFVSTLGRWTIRNKSLTTSAKGTKA